MCEFALCPSKGEGERPLPPDPHPAEVFKISCDSDDLDRLLYTSNSDDL